MTKKDVKILTGAIIIIVIAVIISLVYAGFTGQLNINGTSVNRKSNWDIRFDNLSTITTAGSAKVLSNPSLDGTTTIEDYSVSMTSPGDTISFTFKVVNDGNYNASISSINIGTPTCTGTDETSNNNVCGKLTYTLTDENGASVQVGDKLLAKDYKIMKVTLLYQEFSDASLLPIEDVSISNLDITINYQQLGSALVKDNGEVANYRVYHQGEKITLNNEDYYVIENSGVDKDYVVALKDISLTNLAFGPSNDYDESDVKKYIDNWVEITFNSNELKDVNEYSARLITKSEYDNISSSFEWINSGGWYWTMSKIENQIWVINTPTKTAVPFGYGYSNGLVRPVINVYKDKISS